MTQRYRVQLMLNPDVHAKLESRAKSRGLSLSEEIERMLSPAPDPREAMVLSALSRAGSLRGALKTELRARGTDFSDKQLRTVLEALKAQGRVLLIGRRWFSESTTPQTESHDD